MSREFITMMLLWTLEISTRDEKNIKHRILITRRFYRVLKALHVMFYRPFDKSMAYELLMSIFLWNQTTYCCRSISVLQYKDLTFRIGF